MSQTTRNGSEPDLKEADVVPSVHLPVRPSVCPSVRLSVSLSVRQLVCVRPSFAML